VGYASKTKVSLYFFCSFTFLSRFLVSSKAQFSFRFYLFLSSFFLFVLLHIPFFFSLQERLVHKGCRVAALPKILRIINI
jgi:hypothetical protein